MISRRFGRFPLRFVLIVPFVIINLTLAGLIGYLGHRNGETSVNDLAAQLQDQSSLRVNQQLDSYLETPWLINNLNRDAVRLGQLDVYDQAALERHFFAQMQQFDTIVAFTYADEEQLYAVNTWRGLYDVDFGVGSISAETNYIGEAYEINSQGDRGEFLFSIPDYDPRVRPWYQTAVQTRDQAWTPVFMWTRDSVGIDAVIPIYDDNGRLIGVFDTSLTLNGIGDFLQDVQVSDHGNVFIVDEAGLLVASSAIPEPYIRTDTDVERLSAFDSGDPMTRMAAQDLLKRFDTWSDIQAHTSVYFDADGERILAHVTPYQNHGMRWWVVVMIPESDFMARIDTYNRNTVVLMGVSLLVSVLITTWLARWVTRPILQINRASKALAVGDWSQKIEVNRRDEVGELAHSFNVMVEQQHALFASLQTSETRFRTIFESSIDAIAVTRMGTYVAVNLAFMKIFRYNALDELNGKTAVDFIAPADREQIRDFIQRRAQGDSLPPVYETHGLRGDGSEFDMDVSVSTYTLDSEIYTVTILRDISERKRSERALQRYNERLEVLHEIDYAILAAETPQTIATAALPHIQQLIPVDRVSVWAMNAENQERILLARIEDQQSQRPGERYPLEKEWLDIFRQGEAIIIDDVRMDDHALPMSSTLLEEGFVSGAVIPMMVQGQLIGVLGLAFTRPNACSSEDLQVGREIAEQLAVAMRQTQLFEAVQRHAAALEQRVAERTAELEVANKELREISQMKDQFVSNVSHELRTPITSMLLQLHLAAKTATEAQAHRLDILRREARRLEDLIESLLLLSRLDQDRVTITLIDTDLTELVREMVRDRQPVSEQQGIALDFVSESCCPTITGDPRLIGQVLSILLTNAINYTPSGGQIEVEIITEPGWAGFRVSDTGLGIAEDERERLFSRFFRGEVGRASGKSGTGLGLAIAKEIIDRHHGRIEIESEGIPGRGTTFRIWLPQERKNL